MGEWLLQHIEYLLQRRKLLFEVVQFLQELPLLQQLVFGLVERRVQQVHNMFHVLQLYSVLSRCTHCNGGATGQTTRRK